MHGKTCQRILSVPSVGSFSKSTVFAPVALPGLDPPLPQGLSLSLAFGTASRLLSFAPQISSPFGAVGPSPPVLVSSLANLEEEVFPADLREHPGEHPGIPMERAGPEAQLSTPCIIYLLILSSGAGRRGGQDHLRAPAGVP